MSSSAELEIFFAIFIEKPFDQFLFAHLEGDNFFLNRAFGNRLI